MKRALLIVLFFISFVSAIAQNNSKLALQYYREQDYEKASVLFKDLYSQTNSQYYFSYYIKCLTELKEYKEAEKIIKKQIKKDKKNLSFYVELGYLYKTQGNEESATKQFETAIKKLSKNRNSISTLANAFISKRLYTWAEKTYIKGKKLLNGVYTYNYELANVYFYQRDYDKMINEYLSLLEKSPAYLSSVQNRLQSLVYNSKDEELNEILRKNLIVKIQQNPNNDIFQELLIWFYIQRKDFESAFIQTRAIDKRNKEEGERLLKLAQLSTSNKDYKTAVDCYDYIINLRKQSIYYSVAKPKLAEVLYLKINDSNPTKDEILKLKAIFLEIIGELGKNKSTFKTIINLAQVEAYNLNNFDTAISYINDAIKIRAIVKKEKDEAKLILGDIYLLKGESWNSTLIYAQVEQENRDNPIGNNARFKKAKLAYYTGEFVWAQAQLDVLKASTSKLIANDAFELSALISDNIESDSTGEQLRMYSRADFLIYAKKDSLAILTLDSIAQTFPTSTLIPNALYKTAEIDYHNKKYEKTISNLKEITEKYSFSTLFDDALFFWAETEYYKMKNTEKAMELYKRILTESKGSYFTSEARKQYRILRGDFKEEENFFNNTKS